MTKQNKVREELAAAFIASLKEDVIPWRRGWTVTMPKNAISDKNYRGVNRMQLMYQAELRGFGDPRWCTYKQAKDAGWQVKAGEKGTHIEFWTLYDKQEKKKISQKEADELYLNIPLEEYNERVKAVSNVFTVFNGEQIDGIPAYAPENSLIIPADVTPLRDRLIKNMNLSFTEGGTEAFYQPYADTVTLPPVSTFDDNYAYISTLLHECGHATGHKSRLNRDLTGSFGSKSYAKEELRAEISSAFTAAELNIRIENNEHINNHKAYIKNWIEVLQNDPNELFRAIKDAEKISDYLIEKGEFKELIAHPEMIAAVEPEQTYRFYQMNNDEKYHGLIFSSLEENKNAGLSLSDYHLVYEGSFDAVDGNSVMEKLGLLYTRFNIDHPADFTGHSMSVSDVIVITDKTTGTEAVYYCDRYGFTEYPEFLKEPVQEAQLPEDEGLSLALPERELSFAEQVDAVLEGKYSRFNNLKVCDTPQILIDVGCEPLPMLYEQEHLSRALHPKSKKNSHWHGLTIEQIKKLPELLQHPIMIFDSISPINSNGIGVILNAKDNDNAPLLAIVLPNKYGTYDLKTVDSNFITSVYGKDRSFDKYIERIVSSNRLLYFDKIKSQELFSVLQLQLPQGLNNLDSNKIIHQSENIVNRKNGKRNDKMSDKQLYGVPRKENDIREYTDDGTMYYPSKFIEKEIPENMRYKECDTSLNNDGGIYWVTQEAFSYDDLKKFQAAMIKFDIPTAFVTVRDLSPSYRFRYDIDNSPIIEITHDYIDFDVYNSRCEEQGVDEYCIYLSEMELNKVPEAEPDYVLPGIKTQTPEPEAELEALADLKEEQPEVRYGLLKNPENQNLMADEYIVIEHIKNTSDHKVFNPLEHIVYRGTMAECTDIKDRLMNKEITADFVRQLTGNDAPDKAKGIIEEFKSLVEEHKAVKETAATDKRTVVINAFAGPGVGKTVSCMDICAELKKDGYNAEYVQEYAKELVYDKPELLDGSLVNQWEIMKEQIRRVDRLIGKVDFVVTDSPILLNSIYLSEKNPQYQHYAAKLHAQYDNFNFFIKRDENATFQEEGRIHNLAESKALDKKIRQMLNNNNVFCCTYGRDEMYKVVRNAKIVFEKRNKKEEPTQAQEVTVKKGKVL